MSRFHVYYFFKRIKLGEFKNKTKTKKNTIKNDNLQALAQDFKI